MAPPIDTAWPAPTPLSRVSSPGMIAGPSRFESCCFAVLFCIRDGQSSRGPSAAPVLCGAPITNGQVAVRRLKGSWYGELVWGSWYGLYRWYFFDAVDFRSGRTSTSWHHPQFCGWTLCKPRAASQLAAAASSPSVWTLPTRRQPQSIVAGAQNEALVPLRRPAPRRAVLVRMGHPERAILIPTG
jgi:hypothetical protein